MAMRAKIRLEIALIPWCAAAVCLAAVCAALPVQAAQAASEPQAAASPVVLDRAVAVVNKHVILESDLQDEIRLSALEPNRETGGRLTPQQALEQLIRRTLIEQQIHQEDALAALPSQEEVNARLQELRKVLPACVRANCTTDAGWKAFLAAHGLTPQRVETYLRNRLEILSFIELRFRQGIQISQQEIATYYRDTLLPQYKPGDTIPSLEQVAPRIQEILLQQHVNELFNNWLQNLRQEGDVEVLDPALEAADAQNNPEQGSP